MLSINYEYYFVQVDNKMKVKNIENNLYVR